MSFTKPHNSLMRQKAPGGMASLRAAASPDPIDCVKGRMAAGYAT